MSSLWNVLNNICNEWPIKKWLCKGPPGEPSLKLRVDNEPFGRMEELAVLRAGQTVSLRCTSKGGNPVPSLTFTKNGASFGPGPKAYQNTHTFVATTEDNGAVFGCIAQNHADKRADSKTVRLNVLCKYKNAWLGISWDSIIRTSATISPWISVMVFMKFFNCMYIHTFVAYLPCCPVRCMS